MLTTYLCILIWLFDPVRTNTPRSNVYLQKENMLLAKSAAAHAIVFWLKLLTWFRALGTHSRRQTAPLTVNSVVLRNDKIVHTLTNHYSYKVCERLLAKLSFCTISMISSWSLACTPTQGRGFCKVGLHNVCLERESITSEFWKY